MSTREESIDYAKDYLENMLSFFGLNIDVFASADEDVIELSVPSTHLNGFLIGNRGETLRALQFMVSTALRNNDHELNRVNVDIADYKKNRRERLAAEAEEWISDVVESGEPKDLKPMNAADRRVVHQVAGDDSRVETESVGEGRDRHIVIKPVQSDD